MSEVVSRAVDSCLRVMDLVGSVELPENMTSEIQVRLQKVLHLLRGFEKTAWLKTRKGREAAQDIEGASMNLERVLSSPGGDSSPVMESLSMLEQRVESLQRTIQRLKRVAT